MRTATNILIAIIEKTIEIIEYKPKGKERKENAEIIGYLG